VETSGNGAPSAFPVPLRYREIDFDACIAMVQSRFINKRHPMGPEIMSSICCDKTPSTALAVSTMTERVSRCPRNRWNRSARMRNHQMHAPRVGAGEDGALEAPRISATAMFGGYPQLECFSEREPDGAADGIEIARGKGDRSDARRILNGLAPVGYIEHLQRNSGPCARGSPCVAGKRPKSATASLTFSVPSFTNDRA
jgi:hypothetical protein